MKHVVLLSFILLASTFATLPGAAALAGCEGVICGRACIADGPNLVIGNFCVLGGPTDAYLCVAGVCQTVLSESLVTTPSSPQVADVGGCPESGVVVIIGDVFCVRGDLTDVYLCVAGECRTLPGEPLVTTPSSPQLADLGSCHNSGVMVIAGNHNCQGAACSNSGLIIWMGTSCLTPGRKLIGICFSRSCTGVDEVSPSASLSSPLLS